jgi:hypothetical protein
MNSFEEAGLVSNSPTSIEEVRERILNSKIKDHYINDVDFNEN